MDEGEKLWGKSEGSTGSDQAVRTPGYQDPKE